MKLSFSLSSKTPSSSRSKPLQKHLGSEGDLGAAAGDTEPKPQYVTEFDPSQTLASATTKFVIPPIPNSDLLDPRRKIKNLIPPSSNDPANTSVGDATNFVLDTSEAADAPSSAIGYGLTLRSSKQESEENRDSSKPTKSESEEDPTQWELRRLREDLARLPDDRGFKEFEDVPVESFAAAVLAGYGWSEGQGVGRGNKVDTKIVQYDRRAGTVGLGYTPSADAPRKKHRLALGEQRKPVEPPERIVRVIRGRHAGSKGKVLKKLDGKTMVLKLLDSSEEIQVGTDMVAELGSAEEERCLRRLKEFDTYDGPRDDKSRERSRGEKRNRGGDLKSAIGSQGGQSGNRDRSPAQWLTSHIRVKIVSKDFRRGKFYLKKGEVVDVVSPTTCDILMDGSRELVQGVNQEVLQTALPKRGGSVLVFSGKHRGVYGTLVERDTEKETGTVRDADSHALIDVCLDQMAEYIGDPSSIGY